MSTVDQHARKENLLKARNDLERDFNNLGATMTSICGRMANYAAMVGDDVVNAGPDFDAASLGKFGARYAGVMASIDACYDTLQKIESLGGTNTQTGEPIDLPTAVSNLVAHKSIDLTAVRAEYDD